MDKLYEIVIVSMHLPVIFLLVGLCWQVWKPLKVEAFKYIFYGWVLNSIHVFFTFYHNAILTDIESEFPVPFFVKVLLLFLDLSSSYMFFCATFKGDINRTMKHNGTILKFNIVFIVVIVLEIIFLFVGFNKGAEYFVGLNILQLDSIPTAIIGFISLFLLAKYFKEKDSKSHEHKFLYFGFLFYSVLQLLSIFNPEDQKVITKIGYTLSLLIKTIILYGVHKLFVVDAQKQIEIKQINLKLNKILGRTYHEITAPLKTIYNRLDEFSTADSSVFRLNSNTKKVLEVIETNHNRLIAVVSASMKMYEVGIGQGFDRELYQLPKSKRLSSNNINTLIEIAVISLKDIAFDEERIEIIRDYGKGCNIFCYTQEITQIIYNIIKNSHDSFEGKEGKIIVKSKVHEVDINQEKVRFLKVEFADNGVGIPKENLDKVFIEGFSTKNGAGRGFGLKIIRELMEKNGGTIKIESPYEFSRFNAGFKSGTLVTLTFPTI